MYVPLMRAKLVFSCTANTIIVGHKNSHEGLEIYIIYAKVDIYDMYITISASKISVLLYGNGPAITIVARHIINSREGLRMPQTTTFENLIIN
ncbi:pectinesterase [Medicago truncatula]|uniref:Pectinesterase n=1 Tax=Medicago truncatula TaxID=3880 RepID=G7J6F6_MEDTR|nr:pectinesterase [Medicago truncatula]